MRSCIPVQDDGAGCPCLRARHMGASGTLAKRPPARLARVPPQPCRLQFPRHERLFPNPLLRCRWQASRKSLSGRCKLTHIMRWTRRYRGRLVDSPCLATQWRGTKMQCWWWCILFLRQSQEDRAQLVIAWKRNGHPMAYRSTLLPGDRVLSPLLVARWRLQLNSALRLGLIGANRGTTVQLQCTVNRTQFV